MTISIDPPESVRLVAEMFATQCRLNDFLDPDWRSKPDVYKNSRAIFAAAFEILDATKWKWWSKWPKGPEKKIDLDQLRLEVVDIWVFLMSWIMQKESATDDIEEILGFEFSPGTFNPSEFADAALNLASTVRLLDECDYVREAVNDATECFKTLMSCANMDLQGLYDLYNRKAALNLLRWENGYGTTYVKMWPELTGGTPSHIEDNVWLVRVLEAFPESKSVDDILSVLRILYDMAKTGSIDYRWIEAINGTLLL